eukprot:tig00000388_g24826.t1
MSFAPSSSVKKPPFAPSSSTGLSKETSALLEGLAKQAGVPKAHMRRLVSAVSATGSLPSHPLPPSRMVQPENPFGTRTVYSMRPERKKSEATIRREAEPPPVYRPRPAKYNSAKEKDRLQFKNEFGQTREEMAAAAAANPRVSSAPEPVDRFDEVVMEIEERERFLEEMRGMGAAHQYEATIKGEVAELVRELRAIDAARGGDGGPRPAPRARALPPGAGYASS